MDNNKLLSDLLMLCSCIYEITSKDQIKKVGGRLEDIIVEHFPEESKIKNINEQRTTE